MSYLDIYRSRTLSSGNKSTDGIINTSKETIKNNFSNSLFSESILIHGVEYDAIITQEQKSEDKKILFMPDTKVEIGSVVNLSGNNYLVMDFKGEGINEIYPSGTIKLCNSIYPIKSNPTKTIIGYYDNGKPEYGEVYATDRLEPCIVESKNYATNTNAQLIVQNNAILITIKYQPSETFKVNYEFTMYNNKYKITDIDYTKVINGKGIIQILAERV
jgi:hypothetical protein